MSRLEAADKIEGIVGAKRHPTDHLGRAVSAEQRVYVLHSAECLASGIDLRECEYSLALDRGIEHAIPWSGWRRVQDRPVRVQVFRSFLVPELMAVREALGYPTPPGSGEGS